MAVSDTDVELGYTGVANGVPINVGIMTYDITWIYLRYGAAKLYATYGVDYTVAFADPMNPDYSYVLVTPTASLLTKIAANGPNQVYIGRRLPMTTDFDEADASIRANAVLENDRMLMRVQQVAFDAAAVLVQADNITVALAAAAASAAAALVSQNAAAASQAAALASQTAAAGSASAASTSAAAALASQNAAAASATTASTQAGNASTSATNAATSAGTATTQAGIATTQAGNAAASATTATTQAGIATTQAGNAAASATAASGSATAAATSATNASNSATAAAGSATTAGTQATNASTSATNAATSATTAGTHATNAGNSATAAAGSASAASTSAGTATTQAGIATTQAGNAATSASGASTSAGTATTQAGIATTQAGNAATSATNANNSAIAAAASAASVATATTTEILQGTVTKLGSADAIAALWEQGTNVASAANTILGEGGHFLITGATGITDIDFATDKAGRRATLVFAAGVVLTHSATLLLPGNANITTQAGDVAEIVSEGSDVIRFTSYTRDDGKAVVPNTAAEVGLGNVTNQAQAVDPGANGLVARTAAGAASARTIQGTTNQITVANGSGAAGDPTISLPTDVAVSGILTAGNYVPSVGYSGGGDGRFKCDAAASGACPITTHGTSTATRLHHEFRNTNGVVGSIQTASSATSFNTSSDRRLKTNIRDADTDSFSASLEAIRIVDYDWIADGTPGVGIIADELQKIAPQAVSGGKDSVRSEFVVMKDGEIELELVTHDAGMAGRTALSAAGHKLTELDAYHKIGEEITPQGVDYSKLVPLLIGGMQSLMRRVRQLEGV